MRVLFALCIAGSLALAAAAAHAGAPAAASPAVVVELFTSQGCSSCPPADALLPQLDAAAGPEVIALAYHVDYWNDLGWRDPLSSPRWSERQRRYARRLPAGRVYTPQLVVAGREHVVGSRRRAAVAAIERQARAADASVQVERARGQLTARVKLARAADEPVDLLLAVADDRAITTVARGENAGRRLVERFVVRRLVPLASVEPGQRQASGTRRVQLGRGQIAVVFAQERRSMHIRGAAALR